MAAKAKVAGNRVVAPTAPAPQGEGDWGPTATQPATPVEATATENKDEAQPPVTANTEAAPVVAPTAPAPEPPAPSNVIQQQIANRVRDGLANNPQPQTQVQQQPVVSALVKAMQALGERLHKAKNHIQAFAILNEAERLPTSSKLEEKQRSKAIAFIKQRCFDIQQGVPQVRMGANELAVHPGFDAESNKQARLELEAEKNPDIRELLAQVKTLEGQVKQQEEKKD